METENYQVSKSKGLLALSELNLSLNELKILDIYLSRIDPRSIKDLENETVEKLHNKNLTKKEVKEILDYRNDFIKKICNSYIYKRRVLQDFRSIFQQDKE